MTLWRKRQPPSIEHGPMEGARARRAAEKALREGRERRERQQTLRRWLQAQYEVNGYGRDVDAIWGGRR